MATPQSVSQPSPGTGTVISRETNAQLIRISNVSIQGEAKVSVAATIRGEVDTFLGDLFSKLNQCVRQIRCAGLC